MAPSWPIRTGRKGTSLAIQWLRLCTCKAVDTGLIPAWGTKIQHAMKHGHTHTENRQERQKDKRFPKSGRAEALGSAFQGLTFFLGTNFLFPTQGITQQVR